MTISEPHRCPVCNGTGLVSSGFYHRASDTIGVGISCNMPPEMCRSCNGSGIVWKGKETSIG